MIILKSSDSAVCTLVADRPHFRCPNTLFVTISPNPSTKYSTMLKNENGKVRKCKVRYGSLKQEEQYKICIEMVRTSYIPYFENCQLIGTTELNKAGNVHLHFFISGTNVKDDYDLALLRRQISLEPESIRNTPRKGIDFMNNIVFLTKDFDELVAYMDKDYPKNVRHFPNYYFFD